MAGFFDAHNHLQNCPGTSEAEEALREAGAAGVELMLCNGTSPLDWQKVLALAAAHKSVVPCFGLHPWFLGEAAPGIGLIAVKSGALIQPVRISGAREAWPRGSRRIRFARLTVHIGPAIRLTPEELQAARGKDDYERIAKRIMAAIAAL